MAIGTIVVGVDFSAESKLAAEHAVRLGRQTDATLTLVHTGTLPDLGAGMDGYPRHTSNAYNSALEGRLAADRERLTSLRKELSGRGVTVSQRIVEGFPDTAIPEAAEQLNADLVMVGSHGRTGVQRFLLGSVAERVVRLHRGNVMVARGPVRDEGFAHILIPTDLSESTDHIIETALEVAATGAKITLLHCWHLPPLGSTVHSTPTRLLAEARKEIATEAQARASVLCKTHESDDATLGFVETEMTPSLGIQRWLDENDCDLVVMGSHGRRGVRRFLLGSIAETTVRHAPCSVLVVHSKE